MERPTPEPASVAHRDAGVAGLAALVTGGGSGIGLAAATRLVRDGAHVTICGRTEERLHAAVSALKEAAEAPPPGGASGATGTAAYVVADVTVEADVKRVVESALERDRLDVLFANAGGSMHMGPFAGADVEQVRATVMLTVAHRPPAKPLECRYDFAFPGVPVLLLLPAVHSA